MKTLKLLAVLLSAGFMSACSTTTPMSARIVQHFSSKPVLVDDGALAFPINHAPTGTLWVQVINNSDNLGQLFPYDDVSRPVNLGKKNWFGFKDTGGPVMFRLVSIRPDGRSSRDHMIFFPQGKNRISIEM